MTKRYVLLAAFSLAASTALAQPIPDATYAPRIGTRLQISITDGLLGDTLYPGQGSNVTWIYNFGNAFSDSVHIVAPAQAPDTGLFPGTTHVALSSPGPDAGYEYFRSSAAGYQHIGVNDPSFGQVVQLNPGWTRIPYGLTYNASRPDSVVARIYDNGALLGEVTLMDTITYLGYGSLELNGVVYPDMVLIQTKGTTLQGGQAVDKILMYEWYEPNLGYPRLSINMYEDPQQGITQADATYLTGRVTAIANPTQAALRCWPNPTQNRLHLSGAAPLTPATAVGADGQRHALLFRNGSADVSALAPGSYTLEVGQRRTRFVKQ